MDSFESRFSQYCQVFPSALFFSLFFSSDTFANTCLLMYFSIFLMEVKTSSSAIISNSSQESKFCIKLHSSSELESSFTISLTCCDLQILQNDWVCYSSYTIYPLPGNFSNGLLQTLYHISCIVFDLL